jgi:hypothetical protein
MLVEGDYDGRTTCWSRVTTMRNSEEKNEGKGIIIIEEE